MTKQERKTADEAARQFIDRIVKINGRYGMGTSLDTYDEAVHGSARAYAAVASQARRLQGKRPHSE